MEPEEALAAAGVAVVASVPSAPGGIQTGPLLAELCTFSGCAATSRLPLVRSAGARQAWLAEQLATLGTPGQYYALIGAGIVPVRMTAPWLYIDAGPDPDWLARVWERTWKSVLLLSGDGARVLYLIDVVGLPDTLAHALPTADALALYADRLRLSKVLEATRGLMTVPGPPPRISVRTADLYAAPVFTTLPAFSTNERRETWFVDVFERWRAVPPALDDAWLSYGIGPYCLSFAGAPFIASFYAYSETPAVLAAVWAKAGDRFVILDDEQRRALAFSCRGDVFEARIVMLD